MTRDFKIVMGIRLVQHAHDLDIHNFYDFSELRYSITARTLSLSWQRSRREGVPATLPISLIIEFREVTEFRFRPRDTGIPFSEDDCVRNFGYWTDEKWAEDSVMICDESISSCDFNAIDFMSGAIIIIKASFAHAEIIL